MATPEICTDKAGVDYVSVAELAAWLSRLQSAISDECEGAPHGCNETRAYLYGEICSIRLIQKVVESWIAKSSEVEG